VLAVAGSGGLTIRLALLGAYGLIFNVGDWGWLIGAGALLYRALPAGIGSPVALGAGA
jgi:NCS1 family nucleobase:cation symporter-1